MASRIEWSEKIDGEEEGIYKGQYRSLLEKADGAGKEGGTLQWTEVMIVLPNSANYATRPTRNISNHSSSCFEL
jgi:hypothetical protein